MWHRGHSRKPASFAPRHQGMYFSALARQVIYLCQFPSSKLEAEVQALLNRRGFLKLAVSGALASAIPLHSIAQSNTKGKFKAVVFDAFPIFDPRPVAPLAEIAFPGYGQMLSSVWRTRQSSEPRRSSSAATPASRTPFTSTSPSASSTFRPLPSRPIPTHAPTSSCRCPSKPRPTP